MIKSIFFSRSKSSFCGKAGIVILFLLLFISSNIFAQQGPPYPRLGVHHWFGAQPEWYAQFGLLVTGINNADFVQRIKDINPDCIVLAGRDWNVADFMNVPNEWILKDSNGDKVTISYDGTYNLVDITDYCPRSPAYGNKRYNEYLPEYLSTCVDLNVYNGLASNGTWDHPYGTKNVDLDKNGVNDWDEYGRTWLTNKWLIGVNKVVDDLRNRIGNDKIIHLNSGRLHAFCWKTTNGLMIEHADITYSWDAERTRYTSWVNTAPYPHTFLLDGKGYSKNNFSWMRYLLGLTLVGDGYFSYSDHASGEHHYDKYYDEFDVNLGYPKGSMKQVIATYKSLGIWARFFDNGVVFFNVDKQSNTITDGDIQPLDGYDGPYYRFLGGQDPDFNNGELFDEVTLTGQTKNVTGVVGDAILLLNEPKTVIADIYIDNVDGVTSAGSEPANLVGHWTHHADNDQIFWGMYGRGYCGMYNYSKAQPGAGNTLAEFRPTIGVAGNYEVFEWHGWLGSDEDEVQEATNVPIKIKFANNVITEGYLDQSVDGRQWNSLGIYYFYKGTDGCVTITNEADGQVIADAIKLVYIGDETDTMQPNTPQTFQMSDRSENSISLTWAPPSTAVDGDVATAYQVFRNDHLVGRPFYAEFTDVNLTENTIYSYSIYSVDNLGNRSEFPLQGQVSTEIDETPPEIISVRLIEKTQLKVEFSEKVDEQSAEFEDNYTIQNGIIVKDAQLLMDSLTVSLNTSDHIVGVQYSIFASNILDLAKNPNTINSNKSLDYVGITGDSVKIIISADDAYELFVNGYFIAEANGWSQSETYFVPTIGGTNIIAVKGIDTGGEAGFLAEIEFEDELFVTNNNWKVTNSEEPDWEKLSFDDVLWQKAVQLGLHGSTDPWAQYKDVQGISTSHPVYWIWTGDNENDNTVYFRFKLNYEGDNTAPAPPSGGNVQTQ